MAAEAAVLPVRLDGADLKRFSKVIGQEPVCLAPNFAKFNQSDAVVVSWEPAVHAPPRAEGANGQTGGGANGIAKDGEAHWQAPEPLQDWSTYFVPYAILSLAVVGLIAITLRSRRDRAANKRMPV